MQLQSMPPASSLSSRMKRGRDDDDAATSGSAMGDDDSRRSYDHHHHGEDDDDTEEEEEEEEEEQDQRRRRAACDVLLSLSLSLSCWPSSSSSTGYSRIQADQAAAGMAAPPPLKRRRHRRGGLDDVFECRTCGRGFPTFQALGGHRTSHLRRPATSKPRPKAAVLVHECAMCGLGFSTGQALGGHMRRHRLGRADGMGSGDVDLTHIIVHGRPTSASSLQLLNLFV